MSFWKSRSFSQPSSFDLHTPSIAAEPKNRALFKPGARPQPAEGRLWACAWFTVIDLIHLEQ